MHTFHNMVIVEANFNKDFAMKNLCRHWDSNS